MNSENMVSRWCSMVVRGFTGRFPAKVDLHHSGENVYLRVELERDEGEDCKAVLELVVTKCPKLHFTPYSNVELADFEGEWPPYNLITKPKIIDSAGGTFNGR